MIEIYGSRNPRFKKLRKWYHRRQFIKAYKILRNESERHRAAGHEVWFEAVNEAHIKLWCVNCPELQPDQGRRVF